jgi:DNA-directed RNA polymerase subunit A"
LPKNYLDEIELPKKVIKEIRRIAKERRLNKKQIKLLEEEVKKSYLKSMVEPGEVIGIISAQSISEPATQMTMRTYHFAGAAGIKVTYGLPRLIEVFDAKKRPSTPMMTIFLKKRFNNGNYAKKVAEKIIEKKVVHLMRSILLDLRHSTIQIEFKNRKYARLVARKIRETFKDLRIREKGEKITIIPKKEVETKDLQKLKEKILDTLISGIKGVSNAVVRREENDWIISTIGSNLKEILLINEVDKKRTFSNNIHEVAEMLGVEAARNVIIREASKTLQEQGLDVDIRHLMLVADIMTFHGNVRAIGRYGVAGTKISVLARAAFEETIKHLVRASVRSEEDRFQGIFENVMIGHVIPSGTGMFELIAKLEEKKE